MANISVTKRIQVDGLKELTNNVPDICARVAMVAAEVGAMSARMGIEAGRPEWPALKPATIKAKGHDRKLWKTGEMHDSIHAEQRGQYAAAYGSDKEYAEVHEFGLGDVPQRAFLAPTTVGDEGDRMIDAAERVVKVAAQEANR